MSIQDNQLKNILEAALMSFGKPMSVEQMQVLFGEDEAPSTERISQVILQLQTDCDGRGYELKNIASGYRYQARQDYSEWISRLWEEKPAKYSRAYLETLALIAYRQPVTRAEIEEVRGVSVSSNIVKTMLEREWIRVVGHRDVPGRPALYATTKQFLDYFNMKSLDELPSLAEIKDLDELSPELELLGPEELDNESDELANADDEFVAEQQDEMSSEFEHEMQGEEKEQGEDEQHNEHDLDSEHANAEQVKQTALENNAELDDVDASDTDSSNNVINDSQLNSELGQQEDNEPITSKH